MLITYALTEYVHVPECTPPWCTCKLLMQHYFCLDISRHTRPDTSDVTAFRGHAEAAVGTALPWLLFKTLVDILPWGKKNCVWVSLLELQLGKCSANFSPICIRRIPFSLIMQKWEQYSSTNRTRKSVQGVLSSNLFSYHLVTHWCFVMHPPPLPLICKVPFDLLCRVLSQGNM